MADSGKSRGRTAKLECLYAYGGVISGPPLVYLLGDQKMEGECWVRTWTNILAEIFHQGKTHVNLGQDDFRESEGGRRGEWWRERERDRERERQDILIQTTVQGTISAPSRYLCFRWIADIREKPAL